MATLYFCDLCGRETKEKTLTSVSLFNAGLMSNEFLDLCNDCCKTFSKNRAKAIENADIQTRVSCTAERMVGGFENG